MTFVVVLAMVLGSTLLAWAGVILARQERRLARIEQFLAAPPAGLTEEEARRVAETAAHSVVARLERPTLPPALATEARDEETGATPTRSNRRIKAEGWAAGATETMRRLRQGA